MEPFAAEKTSENLDLPLDVDCLPDSIAIISNQAFSLVNFRGPLIRDLVFSGVRVFALAPDFTDEYRLKIKQLGGEPVDYNLRRVGLNPLRDFVDTLRLACVLRAIKPEATLAYFVKPVIYGTLAAWLAGVPLRFAMIEGLGFVFMDDPSARSAKRKVLRKLVEQLFKFALKKTKRVVLLNRDDIADLSSSRILDCSKAILIPGIGVNLADFPPCPPVLDPPTFVLVARMLREKGVYEFYAAAKIVKSRYPGSRFMLVGGTDTNPGSVPELVLVQWRNEGIVEWVGHVSDGCPGNALVRECLCPSVVP